MAQIGFNSRLFADNRFADLMIKLGSRRMAIGALAEAYLLGHSYYLNLETSRHIPIEEWKKQKIADEIIEVGLAVVHPEGVRLCGADDAFRYLLQKSEAGKKPRYRPLKTPELNNEVTNNGRLTDVNERKRPHTSSLLSSSSLNPKDSSNEEDPPDKEPKLALVRERFDFESVYKEHYPKKVGKSKGLKICERVIRTQVDFENLKLAISNYRQRCIREKIQLRYIKQFDTFMGIWTEWINPDTQDPSLTLSPKPNASSENQIRQTEVERERIREAKAQTCSGDLKGVLERLGVANSMDALKMGLKGR